MNDSLHILRTLVVLAFALTCSVLHSQILRTSYFMEGAQYRMALNPALVPERGYVNLPVVGHTNASVNSDVSTTPLRSSMINSTTATRSWPTWAQN